MQIRLSARLISTRTRVSRSYLQVPLQYQGLGEATKRAFVGPCCTFAAIEPPEVSTSFRDGPPLAWHFVASPAITRSNGVLETLQRRF